MTRLTRKERERNQHRREIMDAARDLFAGRGYHRVTMHDIASEAEFSVGKIYNFFPNKETLYKQLVIGKADELEILREQAVQSQADPIAQLQAYLEAEIRFVRQNIDSVRMYFSEIKQIRSGSHAVLHAELKPYFDQSIRQLTDIISNGIRQRVIRPGDPRRLAVFLDGITTAFLLEYLDSGDHRTFSAAAILDLFLNGAAPRQDAGHV